MGSREHDDDRRRAETEFARPPRDDSTVIDSSIRAQLELEAPPDPEATRTSLPPPDFTEHSSPRTRRESSRNLRIECDDDPTSELEQSDAFNFSSLTVSYAVVDAALSPRRLEPIEEHPEGERTVADGRAMPFFGIEPAVTDPAALAVAVTTEAEPEPEVQEEPAVAEPRGADVIPLFRELRGGHTAREPEAEAPGPPRDMRGGTSAGAGSISKVRPRPVPPKVSRRPRQETLFDHLPRWLLVTDSAAKAIPMLLAVMVGIVTLSIMVVLLMRFKTGEQYHVELMFLDSTSGGLTKPALDRRAELTPLTIETEPPGVLILHDRKILGATPVTVDVPIAAERVGLELSGPYFEPFIGHATRSDTGAYSLRAKLIRRR